MKVCKQVSKKALALLLSLLILATNLTVLPILAVKSESNAQSPIVEPLTGVWSGTTGSLVAGNYELNKYEKAILVCTGLIGDTYTVDVPDSTNDGLVSIDADAQTVTALPYETSGFVWVPSAAVIKYTGLDGNPGTDISVPLNKVGESYVGNFTKPANSYRVEVTYSLYIAVDAALQQNLLNAPYYLVDGYSLVSGAIEGSLALVSSTMNEKMEDLRQMTTGSTVAIEHNGSVVYTYQTPSLPDGAVKTALNELLADYDSNDGTLTLAKYCKEYQTADSKVQFMLEKGEAFKNHIAWFYERINTIGNEEGRQVLSNYAAGLPDSVAAATEEAVQVVINKAVTKADEAFAEYSSLGYALDLSDLKGKTRNSNPTIYAQIETNRGEVEALAQRMENDADSMQAWLPSYAQQLRDQAAEVRSTGLNALDSLESAIQTIYIKGDEAVVEAEAKVVEAEQVIDYLPSVVSAVRTIHRQKWNFIGKELVKDSISAEEYKALDNAVIAALDSGEEIALHDDVELKAELFATSTTLSAMVDQFSVNVQVMANVIAKNSEDSVATINLDVFNTSFPLDKDTAALDVLAAIDASCIENSALSNWDSYYNVGETNYNREVAVTDANGDAIELGALTGDITYTITYSPKTYVINQLWDGGASVQVPYGYNWRLPRPAEEGTSYDYTIDGVSHRENTVFRVVKDIDVNRKPGKAIAPKTMAEIISSSVVPGAEMSVKEKNILNSGALFVDTIFLRTPDSNDKLTKVEFNGEGYKLTAQSMHAGILGLDAAWVPVSATLVLMTRASAPEYTLNKVGDAYEVYFETNELFSSMQVVYQLQISGLDADILNALVNIGDTLVKDTAEQKAALDTLCNTNNFYNNLARVTGTLLGTVTSAVALTPAGQAAFNEMKTLAMNPVTDKTYLYDYLTQYMSENGGLSYYYKGENAANIIKQIELVNKNLPIIWNDPPVQKYLNDMGMAGESARVETILDQLENTNLKPVNALVNTNSPYIDNMLAAVAASGTTSVHSITSDTVVLEQVLNAPAPGLTSYSVEIQLLDKNSNVVYSYKSENFDRVGSTITKAELQAMYDALLATVPNTQYYIPSIEIPEDGILLDENPVTVTGALRPVSYTVKIDGEVDQILYAFDAYTITLPGTGTPGMKYIYTIGGSQVEVFDGARENFSLATSIDALDALFGGASELVITRKLIDTNKANLITFIEKMNLVLSNAGMVQNGNVTMALIPMVDANDNLAVVLRVTPEKGNISPAALASEMMSLIMDLSYVGINRSPLFGLNSDSELKLYSQTLINMLLNSGLGLDSIAAMIESNGDIKEMVLPGMSALGATGDSIVLPNGKVINNVSALGGQLMESTMQYGINAGNCTSVPFYVTYQDFDTQKSLLSKVKKGAEQLIPYVNVNCKDGHLNTIVNAPDSAYAYLLTSLLATGQVRFDTLKTYDLDDLLKYYFSLVSPMFEDDHISADSVFNTMKKTGFYDFIEGFDLEAHKSLMNTLYNALDHVYDHVSQTGSSAGDKYTGELHYDALNLLLGKANGTLLGDLTNMIAEKDTGLDLPITFTLKNRGVDYEALVLDVRADGILNKYYMSRNAADAIAKASDDAIVILLDDVNGNVVVNNDVLLNLNGYTINGDVTAKGRLAIVSSVLDTDNCGGVKGEMKVAGGSINIAAGTYTDDVTSYLESGYYFENNVVSNGIYTLNKNGDDLDIYLDNDYLTLDKSAAKVMALDLVTKLLMNFYGCSELVVDGNTLYAIELLDMTDSLRTPSVLLNKLLDFIGCEGISNFATQFLNDITDFGALADALDNNTALVNYSMYNSAFHPHVSYIAKDDSFALNLTPAADKHRFNIRVFVSENVPANQKKHVINLLREMDRVTNFNALAVAIDEISYNNGLVFSGSTQVDLVVDLTTNINYPVVMAAVLADNASGARRTELINAIKGYQESYATAPLQKALDKMSIAELTSALAHSKSKSFSSILKGLGLIAPAAVELESTYSVLRKIAGTIIDYVGKTGPSDTLGGLKKAGTDSTYYYGIKKSADTYAQLTVHLIAKEKPIVVKDKNGIIYKISDDLAAVLKEVNNGDTVYVNDTVVLAEDVNLPGVSFKLVHASNIVFAGHKLWFVNAKTVLTTDEDLAAHVDSAALCSAVDCKKNGEWYVYTLNGEAHEWEIVPGYGATCTQNGLTDGEWCKHCHLWKVEQTVIIASGHVLQVLPEVPATCTQDGLTEGLICSVCGEVFVAQNPILAHHTSVAVPDVQPDCTNPGLSGKTVCKICGAEIEAGTPIPELGHDIEILPGYGASCTEYGLTEGARCKRCGDTLVPQQPIDKLPHTPVSVPGYGATCSQEGLTDGEKCSVCGEILVPQQPIDKLPHTPVSVPGYGATCSQEGLTDGEKCSVCGEILVPQQPIDKLPHTPVTDPAVPATKDATGLTEGSHCGVCGQILIPQEILQKLPYIHAPQVTLDGDIIRGAKVDVDNDRVSLDSLPTGMTVKEMLDKVDFAIDNESDSTITITNADGSVVRGENDLVCTGDVVSVWATNIDGETDTATYTIIIMGDTNGDGMLNSRDTVRMFGAYVGDVTLEGPVALAADLNLDGKLNSQDTVLASVKYAGWDDSEYESQVK